MSISNINISCNICKKYEFCKDLWDQYQAQIIQFQGNWRSVKTPDGGRLPSPTRTCSHAIFEKYTPHFKNKRLLEVGCGPLSEFTFEFCQQYQIDYLGLDPERLPVGFLKKIPYASRLIHSLFLFLRVKFWPFRNSSQSYLLDFYPSKKLKPNSFDVIYGNNTIEHWHESETNLNQSIEKYKKDIETSFNLLREGGKLIMICPIKVHGNILFYGAMIDEIKTVFSSQNWSHLSFEHWREDYSGFVAYCPGDRAAHYKKVFNYEMENIWILNVVAEK